MKAIKYLLVFILFFASPAWGASPYYVDCNDGGNDLGTFAHPFKTLASAKAQYAAGAAGDDFYFAVSANDADVTCKDTGGTLSYWLLTKGGVDTENYGTMGCYDGDEDFDCTGSGYGKAIVDGGATDWSALGDTAGVFRLDNDYIEIKQLDIRNAQRHCINTVGSGDGSDYIYVHHNKFQNCGGAALNGGRTPYGDNWTVEYNEVTACGLLSRDGGQPASAQENALGGRGANHLYQYNYVYDSFTEGIVLSYLASNGIIQYNVVVNTKSVGVYLAGQTNLTAKYNLIICTTNDTYHASNPQSNRLWGQGMSINGETAVAMSNFYMYGNTVAGCLEGVRIANGQSATLDNINVYNNTFIDNWVNIYVVNVTGYTNVTIRDNSSVRYQTGDDDGDKLCHEIDDDNLDVSGWSIGPNHWSAADEDGLNDASDVGTIGDWTHANDTYGDPLLLKTSGWQAIAAAPTSISIASHLGFSDAASTPVLGAASQSGTCIDPDTDWTTLPPVSGQIITMTCDEMGALGIEDSPAQGGDTGTYNVIGGTGVVIHGTDKKVTLSGE